jgi:hypothetical protein
VIAQPQRGASAAPAKSAGADRADGRCHAALACFLRRA